MDDERVENLVDHLRADHLRSWKEDALGVRRYSFGALAERILLDPQAHIDALVEAGVLVQKDWQKTLYTHYVVVQPKLPHKHEPYVSRVLVQGLRICCKGCAKSEIAPNKLPLELPEDWR